MIYVQIVNDATGSTEVGNYDVRVLLPGEVSVKEARVEDFDRSEGWIALMRLVVDALEEKEKT